MNTIRKYSRRPALVCTAAVVLAVLACADHPLEAPTVSLVTGSTFVGDRVQATKPVFVRSGPGLKTAMVGKQQRGAIGTIVAGPVAEAGGGGRTWWSIDFNAGVDGWGNGQDFQKVGSAVALVEVTPGADSIAVGGSTQLAAVAKDLSGKPISGATMSWLSRNTAVATVSAAGLVTGVAGGATYVVASSEEKSDSARIAVATAVSVVDLDVAQSVSADSALEGSSVTFTVTVTNRGPVAGTGVAGADTLAAGLTYSSHSTSSGSSYSPTDRTWTIGALPAGGTQTLRLTATVNGGTAGSVLVNRARAVAAESDSVPENNASAASVVSLAPPPPPPPPPAGDGEPVDPGSGYLFADNFDRYASVIATLSPGNCPAGTDGYGVPNAFATYGNRTRPNTGGTGTCTTPSGYRFVTGRGGSGNALSNHLVADPGFTQVNNFVWTPNWGSAGITNNFVYPGGRAIVFQIWFKGTGPGVYYGKWFEMWYTDAAANPHGRIQMGIWYTHRNPSWSVNGNGSTDRIAAQPVGPYPEIMTDNQWHRMTIAYKPNSSGYGQNPSSRDGLFRAWIDGSKIIDLSASAMGVTPPGGVRPWAAGYNFNGSTYGPVDPTGGVGAGLDWLPAGDSHKITFIRFPDLANGTTNQLDLAWDDLKAWSIP